MRELKQTTVDRQQVLEAVERALSDFPTESPAEQVITFGRAHEPVQAIAEVLAAQPEFRDRPDRMLQSYMGAGRYSATEAARFLLRMARRLSADPAVDSLIDLLARSSANGRVFTALWGVQVGSPLQIYSDTQLVPFEDVPDGPQKHQLVSRSPGVLHTGPWMPPEAALVTHLEISPLFYSGEAPDPDFSLGERISEIALCLTAIGPSTPLVAGSWFRFDDDSIQEAASLLGSTISYGGHEILPRHVSAVPMDASALEVVGQFFSAEDDLRNKARRSLERLRQSLVRRDIGDRALDLAIALESLLVEGGGEHRYKTALRSALVLGDRRVRARSIIRAVYDLRSSMAHSGTADVTVPDRAPER